MKNTFIKILYNNYKNKKANIMIIDKNGKNFDFAKSVADFSSSLSIYTEEIENYEKTYSEIIGETGLSIIFNKDNNPKIIINLDFNKIIIKSSFGEYEISNGEEFKVPQIYENILPSNIDKLDFYSALYELCGVTELKNTHFDYVLLSGEKILTEKVRFT